MERFGIQINKTSINSVLLIFTIGVTWSSVHHLLDVLRWLATDLDREAGAGQCRRLDAAPTAGRGTHRGPVHTCPTFSEFDVAFKPRGALPAGLPGAGSGSCGVQGDPVLSGAARREGNPPLQPGIRLVGVHPGGAGPAGGAARRPPPWAPRSRRSSYPRTPRCSTGRATGTGSGSRSAKTPEAFCGTPGHRWRARAPLPGETAQYLPQQQIRPGRHSCTSPSTTPSAKSHGQCILAAPDTTTCPMTARRWWC